LTGVLAYCCALVFVCAAASRDAFGKDWFSAGAAQTGRIFAGEWYRVITALGLHADLGHLSSNLVAGSLFGFFASEVLGSGLAWLMILIAGSAGNAINAFFQPASHTSVGASTGIFGALGLLAVVALKYRSQWKGRLRRWAPLAAGLMLLAFMGTAGERVDVGAHVAGFAAGGALGAGVLVLGSPAVSRRLNLACAMGAFVVFLGAWLIALIGFGS
jgi:membrane associated rhomboid family serine protease